VSVKITAKLTAEEAERFMQAVKDGKFAEFGLLDVTIDARPIAELSGDNTWAGPEKKQRKPTERKNLPRQK
jgi:hypothetical protein